MADHLRASDRLWGFADQLTSRLFRVTHRAITKGIGEHCYRDAEVGWIGEIPTHWDCRPLAILAPVTPPLRRFGDIEMYTVSSPQHGIVPCVHVFDHTYIRDCVEYTRPCCWCRAAPAVRETGIHDEGTVVFARSLYPGECAVLTIPAFVRWPFVALNPGAEILSKFLVYGLKAMKQEIARLATNSSRKHLSGRLFRSLMLPLPPLNEQAEIAAFLDDRYAHARARQKQLTSCAQPYGVGLPWHDPTKDARMTFDRSKTSQVTV
jgi:hypothetical protein